MIKKILLGLLVMLSVMPIAAQNETFEPTTCPEVIDARAIERLGITCGYVTVPEYHAQPDGNTIQVFVVIIPSTNDTPGEPLFVVQGGPGGSVVESFVPVFTDLMLGDGTLALGDVVLIEQRGTLFANPVLSCTEMQDLTFDTIGEDIPVEAFLPLYQAAETACYNRLTAEGIDFGAFNSLENAADINAVRQALGYDQINLYGVSYGTMLAQHYMRDYPETLRSVILDAVVPLELDFVEQVAQTAQRAFDKLFAACAADEACSNAYPDLENEFYNLVAELNENPVTFSAWDNYLNPTQQLDISFNGDDLIGKLFQSLYVSEFLPVLPNLIFAIRDGDYQILSLLVTIFDFDFSLASGMYNAVLCAEDADYDQIDLENIHPALQHAFEVDTIPESCALWNVPQLDAYTDDPVTVDVPTLLMSGEYDPITPPAYGDMVAASLPNAEHVVFPATGHGAIFSLCGTRVAVDFLTNPGEPLDTSCTEDMQIEFVTR
ncbi:MAG: alpha/beta fold hydrolase [Chloroflexi bacterium]|nr:MAG: alpha/beta fold hydrolase [Chloroflexota bacterium]